MLSTRLLHVFFRTDTFFSQAICGSHCPTGGIWKIHLKTDIHSQILTLLSFSKESENPFDPFETASKHYRNITWSFALSAAWSLIYDVSRGATYLKTQILHTDHIFFIFLSLEFLEKKKSIELGKHAEAVAIHCHCWVCLLTGAPRLVSWSVLGTHRQPVNKGHQATHGHWIYLYIHINMYTCIVIYWYDTGILGAKPPKPALSLVLWQCKSSKFVEFIRANILRSIATKLW